MQLSDIDLISLLPRAPEKRSTTELHTRLRASGYELTPRTLQRRLIGLSGKFPIACDDRNKPYGWSVLANAPSNLGAVSVQEAVALKLSERYLQDAMPTDLLQDLKHYFAQADSKLKDESLYKAWLGKVRLIPASLPLLKPSIPRNVLGNIYKGVLQGFLLNVTYQTRGQQTPKTYDIEPLAIVIRGTVTYLVAKFPWHADITLLALHRFKSVRVTDTAIQVPLDFDLDDLIAKGEFGFAPTKPQAVHIRFYDGAGAHLEETAVAIDQILKTASEGQIDLQVKIAVTEQFKWWVLAFGDRAEVIAPKALRLEIAARLKNAAARYKN